MKQGYTIKTINHTQYCYVWGDYDGDTTNRRRKETGVKGYTRMEGWRSLGRWEKEETQQKLKEFLAAKYGILEEEA